MQLFHASAFLVTTVSAQGKVSFACPTQTSSAATNSTGTPRFPATAASICSSPTGFPLIHCP